MTANTCFRSLLLLFCCKHSYGALYASNTLTKHGFCYSFWKSCQIDLICCYAVGNVKRLMEKYQAQDRGMFSTVTMWFFSKVWFWMENYQNLGGGMFSTNHVIFSKVWFWVEKDQNPNDGMFSTNHVDFFYLEFSKSSFKLESLSSIFNFCLGPPRLLDSCANQSRLNWTTSFWQLAAKFMLARDLATRPVTSPFFTSKSVSQL